MEEFFQKYNINRIKINPCDICHTEECPMKQRKEGEKIMSGTEKKTVKKEVLNNVTRDDFARATARILHDEEKLGSLVSANPISLLLISLANAELWNALVEMQREKEDE